MLLCIVEGFTLGFQTLCFSLDINKDVERTLENQVQFIQLENKGWNY